MNHLLIIAHAPLASALRACALHVFPDCGSCISVLDVQAQTPPQESLAQARALLARCGAPTALVLTDIFGATPCNVARELVEGQAARLITGANLPMLVRALTYRHENLDTLAQRALAGGAQGVMQVAETTPHTQARKIHDPDNHHHQQ